MAENSAPKIILEKIFKDYQAARDSSTRALEDCTLSVSANEFVCILGPSGCGKSTILHLVAGFIFPSGGRILVDGKEIAGPSSDRGVVFQRHNLFPWKRVAENIGFGDRVHRLPEEERERVVREYIEWMDLVGFERHYPVELSEGMRQRVGIARAYANKPEILLMDEPFASLDAQTGVQMRQLLLRIWEANLSTVVFVTHDVDEAIQLACRIVVMTRRPGRVRREFVVDLPRPRQQDFFMDPKYVHLRAEIVSALYDSQGDRGADRADG